MSRHRLTQLYGIIKTLHHRILSICIPEELDNEKLKLMDILKENGLTKQQITRDVSNRIVLPYVKVTTEPISRILKKFNFTTIFKPVK